MITDEDLRSTRPVPRSMQEAFGPHTDDSLHPLPSRRAPWHKSDTIVTLACAAATVALIAIIAIWG